MAARQPIYLDHHATTPLDPRVLDAMLPYLREDFGNAASVTHAFGRRAAAAVDDARERIAARIGAEPREIVFTSGATEANNLAIQGSARLRPTHRDHGVTAATEHPAVLDDPPPSIWFQAFGEFGIEFQVWIFTSIDVGLTTRSEVHAAINARFAKEGIKIPRVQRDLRVREEDEGGVQPGTPN